MGAVYDVEVNLMYTDEKSASLALSKYLDKCIESGVKFATPKDTSSISSMIAMFLAEHQGGFDATADGEFETYISGFTATYSWSEILDGMFDSLLPYLEDDSYYYQSCDEDYDEYTVKEGKKLLTRSSWRKNE